MSNSCLDCGVYLDPNIGSMYCGICQLREDIASVIKRKEWEESIENERVRRLWLSPEERAKEDKAKEELRAQFIAKAEEREKKYAEMLSLLNEEMKKRNLDPKGPVILARYNPPWTLPFLRRNELMFRL